MTAEPLDWTEDGPRSSRFGDVYFSRADGLAESRAVYLAGCGLPEAWAGRRLFTVAELGFGTGLNVLALLDLWRRHRPADGRLHVFSVEGYLISRADAGRALAAWPELADLAAVLLDQWPEARRGVHRIDFPGLGATLDLALFEAGEALAGWRGRADAWFLDGFAPAKNPGMWREAVLAAVAERTQPGGRAATFTVAGAVRRGLQATGFAVEKRAGFGRKRERLEARRPGAPSDPAAPRSVAVIGAGIAGAATARALAADGVRVQVFDPAGIGGGASGGPGVLVTPRLDAGFGPVACLHAQAFQRAVGLYAREAAEAVLARGVVQLARTPRDVGRFARIAAWDGYPEGALQTLGAAAVAEALDETEGAGGLLIRDALVLDPRPALEAWLKDVEAVPAAVARLEPAEGGWRLLDEEGAKIAAAEAVVVAAGPAAAGLAGLPLRPVRGQLSIAPGDFGGAPAAWGGYAAPLRQGFLFGATHDRDDAEAGVREADHLRNLQALATGRPRLAESVEPTGLMGWAGVRAAAPDHLPLAGALADRPGLFVLTGLGGRGFTLAPLLGEEVAAAISGAPRPLPAALAEAAAPRRYGL